MNCRHCGTPLWCPFLDLGHAPLSNAYLSAADLDAPEAYFPLRLNVCERCWLVQTQDFARADQLFGADYAYFSSTSKSWCAHAERYYQMAQTRFGLGENSFVVEIGSNDGYLLRHFVAGRIPCVGIEPTARTAAAAQALGVPVLCEFFSRGLGSRLSGQVRPADLIIGNNVYAHVPDINDFTAGLKAALKPGGVITLEFPHLLRMIEGGQFDTAYHEHFSYLSLRTVQQIFDACGLRVFDVEELAMHGGSLRVFGCHENDERAASRSVSALVEAEERGGLRRPTTYQHFQARADAIKNDLLAFLIEEKRNGRSVAAYGAAAKGNTLLNYAGVKPDLLPYVCDASPSKQGKFLPGSHIEVVPPSTIHERKPATIVIFPWNIAGEIIAQEREIRNWGGRFAIAVPHLEFLDV
jgi:SAM-dependent methyltransferase